MTTLLHLNDAGILFRLDASLAPRQQEERRFYATEKLKRWMEDVLPTLASTWQIEVSPIEQVDALLEIFCSGKLLVYNRRFRPLNHIKAGVWEFKTADLRIFGWFAQKDFFIGVVADKKDRVKLYNLYAGYAGEVERFRDNLDLDEPKFVPGDDPNEVVSAFDYP